MKKSFGELSLIIVGIISGSIMIYTLTTKALPNSFAVIESRTCCLLNGGTYESGMCYNEDTNISKCTNKYIASTIDIADGFELKKISNYFDNREKEITNKIDKDYIIKSKLTTDLKTEKKYSTIARESLGNDYKIVNDYVLNTDKDNVITSVSATKENDSYNLVSIYNNDKLEKNIITSKTDLNKYYKNLDNQEKTNEVAVNKYRINSYDDGFYINLDNFNYTDIEKIYNDNYKSAVKVFSIYDKTITSNISGFFISKGYVVTSYKYINNIINKSDFIVVRDYLNNEYEVNGIVTFNSDLDLVILKLNKQVGDIVTLSNNALKEKDAILAMGSKNGENTSLSTGTILYNKDKIISLMPISDSYTGSMLLNNLGEVVGVARYESTDSVVSTYTSSSYLLDIQKKLNKTAFNNVNALDVTMLKSQYYYGKFETETVKIGISEELYNNYRGIGDVENTVSLKTVKVAQYNNAISFRYINDVYGTIDTMDMALDFRMQLESSGYILKIDSNNKKLYESSQYKVYIMTEFNYLIIVIIEK